MRVSRLAEPLSEVPREEKDSLCGLENQQGSFWAGGRAGGWAEGRVGGEVEGEGGLERHLPNPVCLESGIWRVW